MANVLAVDAFTFVFFRDTEFQSASLIPSARALVFGFAEIMRNGGPESEQRWRLRRDREQKGDLIAQSLPHRLHTGPHAGRVRRCSIPLSRPCLPSPATCSR